MNTGSPIASRASARPFFRRPARLPLRFPALVLAIAVALVPAGCSAPPHRTPADAPIDVPANWATRAGHTGSTDAAWWLPLGGDAVTALVDEALAHNPDLVAVAARLQAADARAVISGADRLPRVTAGLSRNRAKSIFIGLPVPGAGILSTRSTTYGLSLDTSWEVDLWGRLAAAENAAIAQRDAAAADLAGARLSLVGRVVKAWIGLVEAHLQVQLATDNLASWRANRELVERRYRSGLRSAIDLRILAASEAAARAALAAREQDRAAAARGLDVLLGRYPSAELQATGQLPVVESEIPPGLPAELVARRPDLAASEQRLAAANLGIDVARAAYYPNLSLTASTGTTSGELGDVLNGDFGVWSIFGGLVQPIFEGGRLGAQVELADADAAAALADFTARLLTAFAEVETALDAEAHLQAQADALEVAAEEAGGARDLAAGRYASGIGDIITLLETERGAQDAESRLLTVRRARIDARVDLHLALGGGFGEPTTTSPNETSP